MSNTTDISYIKAMNYFHYIPNLPLAVVGAAAFGVVGVILSWITFRSRASKYFYILPITAFAEVVGYVCRIICHSNATLIVFIIQQLFLLLSPNALALVNYKTCGEIIRLSNVEPRFFFLRRKFVTWFFFWSDIFAFLMQGSGGGLQVKQATVDIGNVIALVGLYVQLFFFTSFICIITYVHKNPEYHYQVEGITNPKKSLIRSLYITMGLLLIRSIYRVVEYQYGFAGPVASAEWAFYVFDGLVILLSFIFYTIPFMGKYLPKRGQVVEVKEVYDKSSETYALA